MHIESEMGGEKLKLDQKYKALSYLYEPFPDIKKDDAFITKTAHFIKNIDKKEILIFEEEKHIKAVEE